MSAPLHDEVIAAILARGEIYEVGGSVRDALLGEEALDRDYLVRGIPMRDLVELLKPYGSADWVGRSFGVIKFTFKDAHGSRHTVDIALPRAEQSTGPGHRDFDVNYHPDLRIEEDLRRRDFTINAMAKKLPGGDLIDPFGGEVDLKAGRLKLMFDEAFREDPLRMLRALGFAARFHLHLDDRLQELLAAQVVLLREVSPERTAEEFTKLFTRADTPSHALRLMTDTGMLDVLLPELRPSVGCDQPGPYHAYDVFEHSCRTVDACPPRLALRWAALLHDVAKPETKHFKGDRVTFYNHENLGATTARSILSRLRYGRELEDHVAILIERHLFNTDMGDRGLRRLIKAVGTDRLADLMALRRADVEAQGMGGSADDVGLFETRIRGELEARRPFSKSDLALDGHTLMTELGLSPGPKLGGVLDHLMERVLDDPEGNDRSTLLRWAQEYVRGDSVMVACALLGGMAVMGGL